MLYNFREVSSEEAAPFVQRNACWIFSKLVTYIYIYTLKKILTLIEHPPLKPENHQLLKGQQPTTGTTSSADVDSNNHQGRDHHFLCMKVYESPNWNSSRSTLAIHPGPPLLFIQVHPCYSSRSTLAIHPGPPMLFIQVHPCYSSRSTREDNTNELHHQLTHLAETKSKIHVSCGSGMVGQKGFKRNIFPK